MMLPLLCYARTARKHSAVCRNGNQSQTSACIQAAGMDRQPDWTPHHSFLGASGQLVGWTELLPSAVG